jgi:hypothetical protein
MDMTFMGLKNKKIQVNISKVKITKDMNTGVLSGSLKTQILWERHGTFGQLFHMFQRIMVVSLPWLTLKNEVT